MTDAAVAVATPAPAPPVPSRRARLAGFLRRHWIFGVLLVAGTVVRVVTAATLWPAMWNSDTHLYVKTAFSLQLDTLRPSGYGLFIHLIPGWTALWPIVTVQHVLGLAMAVGIYVVLLRWRVPPWGAALATAPVLLDPLQISLEHFLLADAFTEMLVVAAVLVLSWRPRFGPVEAGAAGLLLGVAAVSRSVATVLVVIALVATLLGSRRRWVASLVLLVGFALPFGAYVATYHHQNGSYSTSDSGSFFVYGRIGLYVDCAKLTLPADERVLCPTAPTHERTVSSLLWVPGAPVRSFHPPPGTTRAKVLSDFDKRALKAQPLAFLGATTRDTLRGFYPTRHLWYDNAFDAQWYLNKQRINVASPEFRRLLAGGVKPLFDRSLARRLTVYDRLYTPGPLLAACLVVALFAVAGFRRARRRTGARVVVGTAAAMVVASMVIAAATASFSWRYQVLQLALLPFAAALALTVMIAPTDQAESTPDEVAEPVGEPA